MIIFLICFVALITYNKSKAQDCKYDLIKNANFNCEFIIETKFQTLNCKSDVLPFPKVFYDLKLHREEKKDSLDKSNNYFTSFLNSKFDKTSAFYICEDVPSFWEFDPVIDDDICSKQDSCLKQAQLFIKATSIKQLNATGLTVSPVDLKNLTALTELAITNTLQLNVSLESFINLEALKFLNLSNNRIQDLQEGILTRQKKLELVDLSLNRLKLFPKNSFGNIPSLKVLNISHNLIDSISIYDFRGFPNLVELDLSNNHLSTIYYTAFNFNEFLSKLLISHNNLTLLPDKLLYNLKNLKWFSCSQCQLRELKNDLFIHSLKLQIVDLSENFIEILPFDLFNQHSFLEYINFNKNKISNLTSFQNKLRLRVLKLSQNELYSLNNDIFLETPYLYTIDLSRNKLKSISDNHLKYLVNVGNFDLSGNNLKNIELGKTAKLFIRNFNLSNNGIKIFDIEWRSFKFLEKMDVQRNEIEFLSLPPCIPNVKQTITFLFQFNKITKIEMKSLLKDEKRAETDRNMAGCLFNGLSKNFLDITHNPLSCDCHLYPLKSYITRKRRIILDSFLNVGNLTCYDPPSLKNKVISELPNALFSCPVTKNCPNLCNCGIRGQDNKIFVNCTNAGLFEVPQNIPKDTTVLYFDRNYLQDLLSLNTMIWENLTELYADDNEIRALEEWDIPRNLKLLSLKGNKIEQISKSFIDFLSNQSDFNFFLSYNDTNCSCKKKELKNFLLKDKSYVKDIDNITCEIDNNGTKVLLPLYKVPDSILCSERHSLTFNTKIILIWLCLLFIFLLTVLLVYYKQRQLILSFLFLHCEQLFHIFCKDSDSDEDKTFDAFIAYSSCNRDIVMSLLQELEEKEPFFHLCIHERDWLPGRFISDNIIHSVQSSKRTIIVLSDNFISSPWFRLELRAAVFKVSKDKMNKIIVILADSATSLEDIDTELRHVITKRTYLVWGERWFWEKLRYAMPHKSCDQRNENNTMVYRRDSSEMNLIRNENNTHEVAT